MDITIPLRPRTLAVATMRAEATGLSLEVYLESLLASMLTPTSDKTRDRVEELHALGMTDAAMAAAIRVHPGHIADVRRGMNLPANRRYSAGKVSPAGNS